MWYLSACLPSKEFSVSALSVLVKNQDKGIFCFRKRNVFKS